METKYEQLKETVRLFLELTSDHVKVGTYIEPDNYVIKILDEKGVVTNWVPLEKDEYERFRGMYKEVAKN